MKTYNEKIQYLAQQEFDAKSNGSLHDGLEQNILTNASFVAWMYDLSRATVVSDIRFEVFRLFDCAAKNEYTGKKRD